MPQHLSAVRAVAAITGAAVSGDVLDSLEIEFLPAHPPRPGNYLFDVVDAAEHGSAGSVSLILQTLIVPLAMADGTSTVVVRGGTHVEWSPPFDFLAETYLPILRRIGFQADARLVRCGWYPVGGGEVFCEIVGGSERGSSRLKPMEAIAPGPLRGISGQAVGTNVPAHVPQRMASRAHALLGGLDVPITIDMQNIAGPGSGTGLFLLADYDETPASFSGFGRRGKPAEAVAEEAVASLLKHHCSGAAVEAHLSDQLLLPLSFASGPSVFTTASPSRHLITNAWVIQQFGVAEVTISASAPCRIGVNPSGTGEPLLRSSSSGFGVPEVRTNRAAARRRSAARREDQDPHAARARAAWPSGSRDVRSPQGGHENVRFAHGNRTGSRVQPANPGMFGSPRWPPMLFQRIAGTEVFPTNRE
jgi:RNA 3'-terminal phosphate cyclase (ATP)